MVSTVGLSISKFSDLSWISLVATPAGLWL